MKWIAIILFTIHYPTFIGSLVTCCAQDIPPTVEQQLENLTDLEQTETEDDSYLQQLELYRRYPININTAEPGELRELRILTDLQIAQFYFVPADFWTICKYLRTAGRSYMGCKYGEKNSSFPDRCFNGVCCRGFCQQV